MPTLFGKSFSREELEKRGGQMAQFAGIRACELADGIERGNRALEFRTGSGFRFSVLPDRCMDISFAEFQGAPLCWRSQVGDAHPRHYDTHGLNWLRTFQGGMLATCGLMNIGPDSKDQGEAYGVHGRIGAAPASNVQWDCEWRQDEYVLWTQGRMREGRLFGENLSLTRRITTCLGSNKLSIEDTLRNEGFEATGWMMLYHFNCGFPVLDETSEMLIRSKVRPRDDAAREGLADRNHGAAPAPGFSEQVHIHEAESGPDGTAVAALLNRDFCQGRGLGVAIRYRPEELGYLWQWRQLGEGAYVMGLEPCNVDLMPRHAAREAGLLPEIEPGEERIHHLELEALTSQADIDRIEQELGLD